VTVGSAPTEVHLAVPALRSEDYAVVRVLGPTGEPAPSPQFVAGMYDGRSSTASGGVTVLTQPDGSYRLLHAELGEVPVGGRRWVEVILRGFGSRLVEYAPGSAADFTVRFEPTASLRLKVRAIEARYQGRILARLDWRRAVSGRGPLMQAAPRPVPAGTEPVLLEQLQPGEYDVVLGLGGGVRQSGGMQELSRSSVTLASGENAVEVDVPPLHEVGIRVPQAGSLVVFRRDRGSSWVLNAQVPAGTDRVVADGLPAGDYSAHCGSATAEFTVPGTAEVVLR
jgi:hypothetical protein